MPGNKISLCMIVKNEEKFLRNCLNSTKSLVDEFVIVDTGSTDGTLDIAREFGGNIYYFEWCDDFSAARNFSIEKATGDWILILDADEELDPEGIEEIRNTVKTSDCVTAYYLNVINYLNEKENMSDATVLKIVRLFPNKDYIRYKRAIHEEIYPTEDKEFKRSICNAGIFHRGYIEKIHKEKNKGERNVKLLLKSIEKEPHNPFHYYHLGVSYYVQDKLEECIKAFKLCQEKCDYPTDSAYMPSCCSLCAAALVRTGNPEEGKMQAMKALKLSRYFYEGYFNLGKAHLALNEIEEAKVAYKKALDCSDKPQVAVMDRGTGGWKACCELGLIYLNEGNSFEALKYFNKGLYIVPNAKLYINAGHCYRNMGLYEYALQCFEKAHELEPERLDIFYDVRGLYDRMGYVREAIDLLEDVLFYNSSNKELFYDLARRLDYLGDYRNAIYYYTETLVLDAEDGKVYFCRARCYWKTGSTGKAREDIKAVAKFKPELLTGITLYDFMS